MRSFSGRTLASVLFALAVPTLVVAATLGISTQQTRTAAPGAVDLSGASASEGTSLAHARADHVHSVTGSAASAADLSCSGCVSDSELASSYSGVGACGANQWASTLNADATPTCTQPAFSNVSGSVTDAQVPNNITVTLAATATTASTGDSATAFFSSGTLEVGRGGTSTTGFGVARGAVITSGASGTGALSSVTAVATGQVLVSNGTDTDPLWSAAPTITSLVVNEVAGSGTGTNCNAGRLCLNDDTEVNGITAMDGRLTTNAGVTLAGSTGLTITDTTAAGTCTSAAATTCTATVRSGCRPVCSQSTSVSTTIRCAVATTTLTCTFGTSGTNTCNFICF